MLVLHGLLIIAAHFLCMLMCVCVCVCVFSDSPCLQDTFIYSLVCVETISSPGGGQLHVVRGWSFLLSCRVGWLPLAVVSSPKVHVLGGREGIDFWGVCEVLSLEKCGGGTKFFSMHISCISSTFSPAIDTA